MRIHRLFTIQTDNDMKETDNTQEKETEIEDELREIVRDLLRIRQRIGNIATEIRDFDKMLNGYLSELTTDIDSICIDLAPALGIIEVNKISKTI